MIKDHPDAYSPQARFQIDARLLREQITSVRSSNRSPGSSCRLRPRVCHRMLPTSPILSSRAPSAVRASSPSARLWARGAGATAPHFAGGESHSLQVAGATLGSNQCTAAPRRALPATPLASRSRALDLTVDSSMLWVGAGLAVISAILLAFVPAPSVRERLAGIQSRQRQRAHHRRPQVAACRSFAGDSSRRLLHAPRWRQHASKNASLDTGGADRPRHPATCLPSMSPAVSYGIDS